MDYYVSSMCNENSCYVSISLYTNINSKSYGLQLELNRVKHLSVPYICIRMDSNEEDPMEDYLPGPGTYNTQELPCRWSPGPHMFKVYIR